MLIVFGWFEVSLAFVIAILRAVCVNMCCFLFSQQMHNGLKHLRVFIAKVFSICAENGAACLADRRIAMLMRSNVWSRCLVLRMDCFAAMWLCNLLARGLQQMVWSVKPN